MQQQQAIQFEQSTCKLSLQLPLLLKKVAAKSSENESSAEVLKVPPGKGSLVKTQQVLSSPSFNKYDSTNSTSHCDAEDEVRESTENMKLRMILKKRVRLESEDDYTAVICLLNLQKKRQRTSDKIIPHVFKPTSSDNIEQKAECQKRDQITQNVLETVDLVNRTEFQAMSSQASQAKFEISKNSEEQKPEEKLIIKLPSLIQHTQLQQALSKNVQSPGVVGVSGIPAQDQNVSFQTSNFNSTLAFQNSSPQQLSMTQVRNDSYLQSIQSNQGFLNSHFTQPQFDSQFISAPNMLQQVTQNPPPQSVMALTYDQIALQQYIQYNNLILQQQ